MTDANVVLGHLPPRLLGGEMELDVEAAAARRWRTSPRSSGSTCTRPRPRHRRHRQREHARRAAAWSRCRRASTRRSSRSSPSAARAALHANALAALLGCYPGDRAAEPGVLSALGFVVAEIKNEFSQTYIRDAEAHRRRRAARAARGARPSRPTAGSGASASEATERSVDYVVDMRYQRQGFELPIDIAAGELAELTIPALTERFDADAPPSLRLRPGRRSELVSLRAVARGGSRSPRSRATIPARPTPRPRSTGTHTVWAGGTPQEVPTYDRAELRAGMRIQGHGDRRRSTTPPRSCCPATSATRRPRTSTC